jgi:hypothetical protein
MVYRAKKHKGFGGLISSKTDAAMTTSMGSPSDFDMEFRVRVCLPSKTGCPQTTVTGKRDSQADC